MDRLLVTGGARLAGTVRVSGAKNSALKLMAASLLAPGVSVVRNVPRIADSDVMADLLRHFGVDVSLEDGVATLDAASIDDIEAPDELAGRIRASIVVLGPLLARTGRARVALPGGDNIGARTVDLHVRGLERMGATVRSEHGVLVAEAPALRGASITLDYPSVTATENLLLAATLARGTTVLDNVAREPEIADLAEFLCSMGADVEGAGSSTIRITGVSDLRPADHAAIPDRIEVGTWAASAVATLGDIRISNANPQHLELLLTKLADAGADVTFGDDGLRVRQSRRARAMDLVTLPHPGIATDFQPILLAMLATADGTSIVTENVFEARFLYVDELRRMGADIRTEGHHAVIRGVDRLSAAPVQALDIRAGAAMVIAALCANGVTAIDAVHHIDRGYEDLEAKLTALGAQVRREGDPVLVLDPAEARSIPARPDGALAPAGGGPKGLPAVTFRWWEALLVFLIGNLLLGGIAYAIVAGTGEPSPTEEIVAGLAVDGVFLASMLLWLARGHPGSRAALGTRWNGRLIAAAVGLGAALYLVVALVLAGALTWVFDRLSAAPIEIPSQLPDELGTVASVLAVLLAVVAAPVVEELYFRGVLYRSVRDAYGVRAGTAVSASLFGLAHLMPGEGLGVWVIPVVMIVTGVVLARIYERSGSIVTPIVAHMAFNTIGITLILAGVG